MPDVTREEFLRGLRLSRDADNTVSLYGPDGDHVIYVRSNLGLDVSADEIGEWIVAACHEYARWWPVIEAAESYREALHRHLRAMASDEEAGGTFIDLWGAHNELLECARGDDPREEGNADD